MPVELFFIYLYKRKSTKNRKRMPRSGCAFFMTELKKIWEEIEEEIPEANKHGGDNSNMTRHVENLGSNGREYSIAVLKRDAPAIAKRVRRPFMKLSCKSLISSSSYINDQKKPVCTFSCFSSLPQSGASGADCHHRDI